MFEVDERVICIDDSEAWGPLVKGRSYIVRGIVRAGTVVAVNHARGGIATASEDCLIIGVEIDIAAMLISYGMPGFVATARDFWSPARFRRPQRLETRTALADLIGLANTTREPVDA